MSMYIGAAYYPEMWDESEIDKDIARCKDLGINALRVAEFAWGKMEPSEGKFDFEWLQKVVDKLYQNGIATIMCTPTATPPRWMLDKYPEMKRVMPDLVRSDVSSRCHVCKTSEMAREKNRIIVTELAKAFKGHKGIIGWQIDNEIFPYEEGCFCENCKKAFRVWLEKKYGTIDNLNRMWGMVRWSLEYDDFDAIQPPYPGQWKHPSLRTEWWNFQCYQICTYVWEQADVIRKFSDAPIGTDMMANNFLSYYDVNKNLDVIQYNHYDSCDGLFRNSFAYDFLRPIKEHPFWVVETQVGWNGSEYAESGFRPVGNCYANTWLPIAKGAEMNLYWLFRTHPNGHEIGHGALYTAAGREYRVSQEVRQACTDISKCEDFLSATKVVSKAAIHYSATTANLFHAAPLMKEFDYRETLIKGIHKAFQSNHVNVDVIDTPRDLSDYEVLVSPFLMCIEDETASRIQKWVENGGTWLVGPMSGVMTQYASKFTHSPCPIVENLGGVYLKYQKPIDNNVFRAKWNNGTDCEMSKCFDAYELRGAKSLAAYVEGDEFAGYSVVAENKLGKGKVVVLGSLLNPDDLFRLTGMTSGVSATPNLTVVERSGKRNGMIVVEHEAKDGTVTLCGSYKELITGKMHSGTVCVHPYEVLVLERI